MKLLLDTNALIRLFMDDEPLHPDARRAILDENNSVYVSAVSLFEMAVKCRIGKLAVNLADVALMIDENDIEKIGILDKHCFAFANVVSVAGHRDPFDLMLVAQAMTEGMTIVTRDLHLKNYPVNVMLC